MRISVVITVLNEQESILGTLCGLAVQKLPPDEVIIVDGGSTDQTVQLIKLFQSQHRELDLKLFEKPGNRSEGRNYGIKQASYHWIAITDAGCIPDKIWLEKLAQKAEQNEVLIVAGYYRGAPQSSFEQAVIPYMLVMPDQINQANFLPATRSMLVHKSVWKEVGGFDEKLLLSEDYAFAKRIQRAGYRIVFSYEAQVTWRPIKNLRQFFVTAQGMTEHDVRAGITRNKARSIVARYLLFIAIYFYHPAIFLVVISIYLLWSLFKNAQYLSRDWWWLPILQVTADFAVMSGLVKGVFF